MKKEESIVIIIIIVALRQRTTLTNAFFHCPTQLNSTQLVS